MGSMRARGAGLVGWGVLTTWVSAMACGRVGFESLQRTGEPFGTGGTNTNGAGGTGNAGSGGTVEAGGALENGTGGALPVGGIGGASDAGGTSGAGGAPGTGGFPDTGGGSGGATSPIDAGEADAAPCGSCAPPTGLAFTDITRTVTVGGTGGAPTPDSCPENEVVIGYAGANDSTNTPVFLTRLGAICGKPTLSAGSPYTITITESRRLTVRGVAGDTPWETRCPPNQAVIGFDGNAGNYVFQLSLHCAPLIVTSAPSGNRLTLGAAAVEPGVGGIAGANVSNALCPTGEVVRGTPLRAGNWVDAFSMWCSKPTLTHALGSSCESNADCDTAHCAAGVCSTSTCVPSAGCTCGSFDEHDYAFCANAKTEALAEADCETMGMKLVRIDGAPEDGWIKSTSSVRGTSPLFIGGNSNAVVNEWRWMDGTLFFIGGPSGSGPQNGLYVAWETGHGEPVASPACITLPSVEAWGATTCTVQRAYVCERY